MKKALCAVLALSIPFHGCATMIFQNPEDVTIRSNVPGALAKEGGVILGATPCVAHLDRMKTHEVTISAEGYETKTAEIKPEWSWWRAAISVILNGGHGLLTLFISTALGIGVDIASGSWFTLETEDLAVDLDRAPASSPAPTEAERDWPSPSPVVDRDVKPANPVEREEPASAPLAVPTKPASATHATAPRSSSSTAAPPAPRPSPSPSPRPSPSPEPSPSPSPSPRPSPLPEPSPSPSPAPSPTASPARFCQQCGARFPETAKFCPSCGAPR